VSSFDSANEHAVVQRTECHVGKLSAGWLVDCGTEAPVHKVWHSYVVSANRAVGLSYQHVKKQPAQSNLSCWQLRQGQAIYKQSWDQASIICSRQESKAAPHGRPKTASTRASDNLRM